MEFLKKYKFLLFSICIVAFFIFIDQITKTKAIQTISQLEVKTNYIHKHIKITPFFNIVLIWNSGISFGMLNNNNYITSRILIIITTIISLYILYLIYKSKNYINAICYSLIFAGAIGNIIDRIKYSAVVDFLDFHLFDYHWPAFNIADSCVFIGVFLLLLNDFITTKKHKNEKA